jgi:hypothetical protein
MAPFRWPREDESEFRRRTGRRCPARACIAEKIAERASSVAGLMPVRIVEPLEVVDPPSGSDRAFSADRAAELALERFLHVAPVEKAGERVADRLAAQARAVRLPSARPTWLGKTTASRRSSSPENSGAEATGFRLLGRCKFRIPSASPCAISGTQSDSVTSSGSMCVQVVDLWPRRKICGCPRRNAQQSSGGKSGGRSRSRREGLPQSATVSTVVRDERITQSAPDQLEKSCSAATVIST